MRLRLLCVYALACVLMIAPRRRSYLFPEQIQQSNQGPGERDEKSIQPRQDYQDCYAQLARIEAHIKAGEYQEALARFNPQGIAQGTVGLKATYDLVNVLVHRQTVATQDLMCEPTYRKLPKDHSYSVKICGLLIGYLNNGQLDPQKLQDLDAYFESHHQDEAYLLQAVTDLQ